MSTVTEQKSAWRMKLIAPPMQWNLEAADWALAYYGYRHTEHWRYSTTKQALSANIERTGRLEQAIRRTTLAAERSAPESVAEGQSQTGTPSAMVTAHPISLNQIQ